MMMMFSPGRRQQQVMLILCVCFLLGLGTQATTSSQTNDLLSPSPADVNAYKRSSLLPDHQTHAYMVFLEGRPGGAGAESITRSHLRLLASVVGSLQEAKRVLLYSYRHSFSGFAARLTLSQARLLQNKPGVILVVEDSVRYLNWHRKIINDWA